MHIITVCSFKGGVAKTSSTLNLGAALAKVHKKKVLLVDFDAQANLSTGLGFDPDAQDSLAPVLQGIKSIDEVICDTHIPGLSLIPADSWLERVETTDRLAQDRYSHERLKEILEQLNYDFILIDTPPSLSWLTESALIAATHALVCTAPEFYSIKGLQRLSLFMNQIAQRHPFELIGVLLSFWNHRGKTNLAFQDVIDQTFPGKELPAKIRRDIAVSEASIHGKAVFETRPQSRAADDYLHLTKVVLKRCKALAAQEPAPLAPQHEDLHDEVGCQI
ncbi:MAG: Sporulation initiation inhibitor protein Soj [Chlamydiia bacterium]|nr:Sporulation initiation inhibitor protein Soj [Chlamydiia bacterium]